MKSSDFFKKMPTDPLDRIFSVLRHELANSVNSLKVTLDVLCSRFPLLDDGKKMDLLQLAQDQVARQHRLIDGLKAYTGASAGELTAMDMDRFWPGYVETVSARLAARNIRFNSSVPMENCVIRGNPAAVSKLLDLLVDNAVDAVDAVEKPAVDLSAATSRRFLTVIIGDNGEGVMEDPRNIFIPFFSTRKDRQGLGVPIACKFLAGMGGDLTITRRPGGGSAARVRLVRAAEISK